MNRVSVESVTGDACTEIRTVLFLPPQSCLVLSQLSMSFVMKLVFDQIGSKSELCGALLQLRVRNGVVIGLDRGVQNRKMRRSSSHAAIRQGLQFQKAEDAHLLTIPHGAKSHAVCPKQPRGSLPRV